MNHVLACTLALSAVAAWAGGGKEESTKAGRAATGASSPGSTGGSSTVAGATDVSDSTVSSRDRLVERQAPKRWEALVGYELHRMWIQTDLGGDAPNKLFNYWYASFRFDATPTDRLKVRFGVYQRFLADPGETGLRTDDLSFSYTHVQQLPGELSLAGTLALSAPVSFYSQLSGMITAPTLAFDLSRRFGFVTVALRPFGVVYWQRYDSEVGGAPNPKGRVGVSADVYAEMPFLPALTVGVDAYTGYAWFYMPHGMTPYGTVQDATFASQPVQQSYGGEVYVRYAIPTLWGIKSDLTVALANGDPTLGYTSRLHDGQSYFYMGNRHTAELYANLTIRY